MSTCLSLVIEELRLNAEATLEHLKWEDLILLMKRTNTGCGHFFSIAVVQEIDLDLEREREGEREGEGGGEGEGEHSLFNLVCLHTAIFACLHNISTYS